MGEININSKFTDQSGDVIVVELDGHIDQSNSHQLQKMFDNILQSGCYKVIVDFNRLVYMSSSGWGVFVGEIKRFRDLDGDIKLTNMNPEIYDVYQMLEFYHIFDDYNSIEDASASFRKNGEELDLVAGTSRNEDNEAAQEPAAPEAAAEELTVIDEPEQPAAAPAEIIETHNQEDEGAADENIIEFSPQENIPETTEETKFIPLTTPYEVKLASLPIGEKIKRIIAENPFVSPRKMRKILKHEKFGYTKIGFFQLRKLLRELDLNSKQKRYRYYRSC